jgi:hypothetical protein
VIASHSNVSTETWVPFQVVRVRRAIERRIGGAGRAG